MQNQLHRVLFLVCCAGGLLGQVDDPASLFQKAAELQQEQDWPAAVRAYREFLSVRADDVGALSNLGVVLAKMGRYDEALTEYDKADKIDPNDPRIVLNIALAYSKSGRLQQAKDRFNWLHSTVPRDSQVTMLLADTCLQLGEYQAVIHLLEPVEDSEDLAVAYMLGTALLRSKRTDEGQLLLDRILRHGDSAEARFLLGTRMFESGDYPAAVKQFESAAEIGPELEDLQSFLGQALLFTGDPDGASQAFQRALQGNPNDFRANLGQGQILAERRNYEASLPLLEKAAALRPQSSEAFASLGHALLGLNHLKAARTQLETSERLGDNSLQLHEDLSRLYAGLKLTREAARESQDAGQVKLESSAKKGPKVNATAPEFSLPLLNGSKNVSLSDFRGKTPVVLVFGSYSCPNFRGSSEALKDLAARYGSKVPFLLVYIREAHGAQTWESTRNIRDGIATTDVASFQEKREHAMTCSRELHLNFPALVDGLDGAVERAYAAWPSRAVIVGTDGRLIYTTRLTELDFRVDDMEQTLKRAAGEIPATR